MYSYKYNFDRDLITSNVLNCIQNEYGVRYTYCAEYCTKISLKMVGLK